MTLIIIVVEILIKNKSITKYIILIIIQFF